MAALGTHDYGEYGGVSLEAAMGGEDDGYDYGEYGGVSLEDAAAFTSSDEEDDFRLSVQGQVRTYL